MEMHETVSEPVTLCTYCRGVLDGTERFCGNCGKEVYAEKTVSSLSGLEPLKPTLVYYFSTLILLATYKATRLFPGGFDGSLLISLIDAAIVIGFWFTFRKQIAAILSFAGIRARIILFTVTAAFLGAVVVSVVAGMINISLYEDVYYGPYLYEDTSYPLFWTILLTCLFPAVLEEVAFRGFLFDNIRALTSGTGAIYVTGFVFGIIHLSVFALLWLIPIGLAFGWLRLRYNTLWYGIIGHFFYNLFVSLIDFEILSIGV